MLNNIDLTTPFEVNLRPRFEGCNVGTWIGFKHVFYLVEEAIITWFRAQKFAPSYLLEECAQSLEITQSNGRLLQGIRVDDVVKVCLTPKMNVLHGQQQLQFKFTLWRLENETTADKLAVGRAHTLLLPAYEFFEDHTQALGELTQISHEKMTSPKLHNISNASIDQNRIEAHLLKIHENAVVWPKTIPYFYCHNTYRLQYSGYLRLMEEVVDVYLRERGIAIGNMLYNKKYNWIPVVSGASLQLLEEAFVEETLYTVMTVEDIVRDTLFNASIHCYVYRDGKLVNVATGMISHAYIQVANRRVGTQLANFDEHVTQALLGKCYDKETA